MYNVVFLYNNKNQLVYNTDNQAFKTVFKKSTVLIF